MLKGIPAILPPELLMHLCEMGHSDRLLIADGNYPVHTVGENAYVIRMDGHGVCEILDAVLQLLPLDTYVEKPVSIMQKVPGERFAFYEEAKSCYVIIATSEKALYGNIMLQKGVV